MVIATTIFNNKLFLWHYVLLEAVTYMYICNCVDVYM